MSVDELFKHYKDKPVGESIESISRALAETWVYLATDEVVSTQPTDVELDYLRFKTGLDNEGRVWAYAYTSEAHLLAAFPDGSPYYSVPFADFFQIVDKDKSFGGIFINASSEAPYLIPRELFDDVEAASAR